MEEYSKYYRIAFEIHKKYAPCPADPEAGEAMALEMAAACSANGNHPFLTKLLAVVYDETERQYINRRKSSHPE